MAKTLKGHSVRPMKRGFGMHERKGQGTDLSLHQRRGTEGAEEESSSRPDKKEIAPRPKKLMSISRFIAVQTGVRASGNGVVQRRCKEQQLELGRPDACSHVAKSGHGFTASELLANPLSGPWTTGGPFAILKIRAIERSRSHEWAGQIRRAPGRRGAARARGRDPVLRRRSCARYGFRAQQHRHIRAARARKTDAWRAGTRPQPENRTLRWRIGSVCSKKTDEKGATGCGHAGASAASLCTRTSTRSCPCSSCRGREDESEPGDARGAEFEEDRWPRWKWARMTQPNAHVRALDATEGGVFSTAACLDNPNLATEYVSRAFSAKRGGYILNGYLARESLSVTTLTAFPGPVGRGSADAASANVGRPGSRHAPPMSAFVRKPALSPKYRLHFALAVSGMTAEHRDSEAGGERPMRSRETVSARPAIYGESRLGIYSKSVHTCLWCRRSANLRCLRSGEHGAELKQSSAGLVDPAHTDVGGGLSSSQHSCADLMSAGSVEPARQTSTDVSNRPQAVPTGPRNAVSRGGARSLALFKHHSASTSCVSASKLEADWTWCPEYLLRRDAGSATSRGSVDEEAGKFVETVPKMLRSDIGLGYRGLVMRTGALILGEDKSESGVDPMPRLPEFFFFLIFLIRDSRLRIGGTAQVWTFIQGPRIESSPHLIMPSLEKSDPTTVMTPQDSPQSATVGDSPV
ncbi:hypothetical protein FB451DRAFT_1377466 [Mycena latifolia]|nr:hypothetical protein FB451DRAFT_1377466 [Mycena latifolia]